MTDGSGRVPTQDAGICGYCSAVMPENTEQIRTGSDRQFTFLSVFCVTESVKYFRKEKFSENAGFVLKIHDNVF